MTAAEQSKQPPEEEHLIVAQDEEVTIEYHPENSAPNDVQLGLLGNWVTVGRTFQRSAQSNDPAAIFFPQTGHNLLLFKEWWSAHGGLSVFGYPISGELQEKNAADGKGVCGECYAGGGCPG